MKTLVILISGRGSNMQAIVEARIAGIRIAAVIANRPDAAGLRWAAEAGIATHCVDHTVHRDAQGKPDRVAFESLLAETIDGYQPDLVVLAGFMRILTPAFTARYAGRLINIHPALLPDFPGLDTHARALAAGHHEAGCTVHWVEAEVDSGAIIAQARVPVLPDDDAEHLAARVLRAEHRLYPQVLQDWVRGAIRWP